MIDKNPVQVAHGSNDQEQHQQTDDVSVVASARRFIFHEITAEHEKQRDTRGYNFPESGGNKVAFSVDWHIDIPNSCKKVGAHDK